MTEVMNKILFFLGVIFSFTICCCEKERDVTFEYTKSLVNETDEVLFYFVNTTKGNNSAFSYGHDSIGFYFVHSYTITLPPVGPYSIHIDGVGMREEKLYDLTDTSFFQLNLNRSMWTGRDSLYWNQIEYTALNGPNWGIHEMHFETLRFRDTLLSIMQKDYTMLEKFKAYYGR
jgi:hypothetical protein